MVGHRRGRTSRGDAGVSRAVELAALLLVSAAVVVAVLQGGVREQVRCLAEATIIRLESSGGSACGTTVERTRVNDDAAAAPTADGQVAVPTA